MKKMSKEQLSEAIEEGIFKGFWKPFWLFIIILLCFVIVISLLVFVGEKYQDWKCYKENNCSVYQIQEQSCFPLENLNCHVAIGNETTIFWTTGYFTICGYQEANAFYEQLKPRIEEDIKIDNQIYHRNSKIRYLECN